MELRECNVGVGRGVSGLPPVVGTLEESIESSVFMGTVRPGDVMRAPPVSSFVASGSGSSGLVGSKVSGSDPISSNHTNSECTQSLRYI